MKKAPTSTRLKLWLASYRRSAVEVDAVERQVLAPKETSPFALRFSSFASVPALTGSREVHRPFRDLLRRQVLKNSSMRNLDRE